MALPVWTVLCLGPDWRYMADRTDNPWYPTMRLFRQTKWNDWTDVTRNLVIALQEEQQKRAATNHTNRHE